uniref:Uncharacterized protein n=1 Tax=Strongyloides venezuelensis TaxID=75913 RepID=A0A0K0G4P7_STRVS
MRLFNITIFLTIINALIPYVYGLNDHYSLEDLLKGKLPRTKRDILDYLNIMDFEWVQKFVEKLLGDLYVDLSENDKFVQTYTLPVDEEYEESKEEVLATTPPIIENTTQKTMKLQNITKARNIKNKVAKVITITELPFLGTTTTRRIQIHENNGPYKVITPKAKNNKTLLRTGTIKKDNKTIVTTSIPLDLADFCISKCEIPLECGYNEKLVRYAYLHNSGPEDTLKALVKESQIIEKQMLPVIHKTVNIEVVQFTMNVLRAFKPLRSLVVGVFTGYSTIAVSLMSNSEGIVVGIEDPELIDYWEAVGKKASHHLGLTQRIQIRATDAIDRELHKLAQYEPTAFDFILLDDFKYENYLIDYEMCVNILRKEGILIITSSFTNKILSQDGNEMTEDDKVLRALNHKIKNDPRVVSTLLPISDGTWFIVKK